MFDDYEPDSLWEKIQFKYWNIVPYDLRPGQLYYKTKCFLFKRYSTVKSRYLGHTWCDRSELLLYTSFEILSDFIENECSPGHIEWYGESGHKITVNGVEKYVRDEMQELYDWWQSCHKKPKTSLYEKEGNETYKHLLDPTFHEYSHMLWSLVHAEEIKNETIPLESNDGKVYAYEWKTHYKDEQKHHDYVRAAAHLERMHDEFVQNQLHRLVNIRHSMWT